MERGSEPRAPLSEAGSGWQLGNKLRAQLGNKPRTV